jgi:trans-aconitate methyltransferase
LPIRHSPASDKWHDRAFIRVWDAQPQNVLKAEQLDILAAVIKDNWRRGARILDLGCGTGRTEALILERLPVARFVCVDRSEVMLGFARERLQGFAGQCRFVTTDLDRPRKYPS